MVKHRSATLMALPVVATLVLSGCGSGQKPTAAAAPTSSSATASAAPTTSAASPTTSGPAVDPNIPAAARAKTAAGSEAFVRYFFARLNASYQHAEPQLLDSIASPSCRTCAAFIGVAADMHKRGQHYNGEAFSPSSIASLGQPTPTTAEVLATGSQMPGAVVNARGAVVEARKTSQRGKLVAHLTWLGSAWTMSEIKVMA